MLNYINKGQIDQKEERLFTVRPRSAALDNYGPGGGGNRGTRARFRLLTTDVNRSFGTHNVVGANGFSTPQNADSILKTLINNNPGIGYTNFLLTNVSVNFNEKVQITQTFGDAETVYYFGKAPVIFNLSGMLMDDIDNQWFTMFIEAYSHILRGTELARNYELVELVLPNMVVIGTIMSFAYQQDAARDTDIPFTMQMHAKEVRPIPVQIPNQPISNKAGLINFKKAEGFTDFTKLSEINSLKTKISQMYGIVQNPLASSTDFTKVLNSVGGMGDSALGGSSSLFNTNNFGGLAAIATTGGAIGRGLATAMSGKLPSLPGGDTLSIIKDKIPGLAAGNTDEAIANAIAGDNNITGATSKFLTSNSGLTDSLSGLSLSGAGGISLSSVQDNLNFTGLPDSLEGVQSRPDISTATQGATLSNGVPSQVNSAAAFQSSLFSPVFGVLTSITKVVTSTGGDITKIISSFTNPVNTVLRDIQGIASQAISIVRTVETQINNIVNQPLQVLNQVRNTVIALRRAAGVISRAPETIGQIFKRLTKFGSLKTSAPFLTSGGKKPNGKKALLNSGKPYTPASGANATS